LFKPAFMDDNKSTARCSKMREAAHHCAFPTAPAPCQCWRQTLSLVALGHPAGDHRCVSALFAHFMAAAARKDAEPHAEHIMRMHAAALYQEIRMHSQAGCHQQWVTCMRCFVGLMTVAPMR
jgi:hypothetical protein